MLEKSPPAEVSFQASGGSCFSGSTGNLPPASEWGAIKFARTRLYARAGFSFKVFVRQNDICPRKLPWRRILYSVGAGILRRNQKKQLASERAFAKG
jgi:hypothetical protein